MGTEHHHLHALPAIAIDSFNRHSFPPDFTFGVATSALQIEGASSVGGKVPSVWDSFAALSGKIADGSTPAVACDHFHKFHEDILEMKRLGVDAYRFSISWPRLFSDASGTVNMEGISFYNRVIDSSVKAGLTPYVTLYHWDLPQYLDDDPEVKGWRTKNIVKHFVSFADTCFKHFGDRVKHWITFNEICLTSIMGSGLGLMPPGSSANKATEPYILTHHQLLSHAAAVTVYRSHYQEEQEGMIGLTCDVMWHQPLTDSQEDKDAAQRFQEFETGWILDAVITGSYPKIMRDRVGSRLPSFTLEESKALKGSVDFVGVNYYSACFVKNEVEEKDPSQRWWQNDTGASWSFTGVDGKLIGDEMGPEGLRWFYNCPWGLRKSLAWIDSRYGKHFPIFIFENGTLDPHSHVPLQTALEDTHRTNFIKSHLQHLCDSIRLDKVNVKGYFLWTFMDDWEWMNGFNLRFGLYYVDFKDKQLARYPKASAKWFSSFLLQGFDHS